MSAKRSVTKQLKFIDLFAGIGGFHTAATSAGMKCVFVSEIDPYCKTVYEKNFGISVQGDITKIDETSIQSHDVLFAGFPCQPFSKGGFRKGFSDNRGNLFFDILRILKHHKPTYFILENVQNLVSHDSGNTYEVITNTLRELGYSIPEKPLVLSPHQFGVPVLRRRIYIPGIRKEVADFSEKFEPLRLREGKSNDIYSIIDKKNNRKVVLKVSEYEERVISMWNEFYLGIDIKVIGFPIWADYFTHEEDISLYPSWKQGFIEKNRALYTRNKKFIDTWLRKHKNLDWVQNTHRKFEWQAGTSVTNIYETLIQFRPSGVRVKAPTNYSTLVAMNHNQIVGKYMRRLTPDEAKKLQSFPDNFELPTDKNIALKQLGNAVNVTVVQNVLAVMLSPTHEKS
jgi:DNA (cytosine-5)-methyltransferase 1